MNSDDKTDKSLYISYQEAMKLQSDEYLKPFFDENKKELEKLKDDMNKVIAENHNLDNKETQDDV